MQEVYRGVVKRALQGMRRVENECTAGNGEKTLDALRLHTNPWSNNRGPVVMLHGGEAPCPCGNIDISIRWYADCESPLSLSPLLSFGKSSTVINNLRTGSRSTQSVFREKLVQESNVRKKKRKRKKMSPPRIFVRRCIKQISLPLARRYPSLYPNKSFIIELRSISLSIVLIHIEGI